MDILAQASEIIKNISWNYLFFILLAGALIGGVFAMARGVYRTTTKYIVEGILVVILVLCMPSIVSYVSGIDFSRWFNINMTVDNVNLTFTSVDQTVINYLLGKGYYSSSDPAIYASSISLAHSALGLILFFFGMVGIVIITPVLTWLVYLLTFTIFLSKEKRKNKKHRLISAFEGVVCGTVIASLFLAPFTSLVTIASQTAVEVKETQKEGSTSSSSEDFNALIDFLVSYQDSAFFTAITFGDKSSSKALDTSLMKQVSEVTIDGVKTSFYTEIGELLKTLSYFGDALEITVSDSGQISININIYKIFDPEIVNSVLNAIETWKSIMYLIPALAEIGTNIDQLKDFNLDLSEVEWNDVTTNLKDVYKLFYDAGLIETYAIPFVKGDTVPNYFVLDMSKKDIYKEAINKVLDNPIIKKNLPVIIYNLSKLGQLDYFVGTYEDYENLDYKTVFSNMIDFLFYSADAIGENKLYFDNVNEFTNKLIDLASSKENTSKVKALLCGGDIIYTDSDGNSNTVNYAGLLDNPVFSPKIIDFSRLLVSTLSTNEVVKEYLSEDEIREIGSLIKEGGLKSEVSNLIGAFADAYKLMNEINTKGKLDLEDETQIVLNESKNSLIVKKMLPRFIKNTLKKNAESFESSLMGFTIDDFDFDPKDNSGESIFVDECIDLVDLAKDIIKISNQIKDSSSTKEMLENLDIETLRNVLNNIIDNKILNPDVCVSGISGDNVSNYNFNRLIKTLFKQDNLTNIGFEVKDDLSSITWKGSAGEIEHILDILEYAKNHIDLFTSSITLSTVSPSEVQTLIELLSESEIFKDSISSVLTKTVSSSIEELGVSINFYCVTDWKNEASKFANVIEKLQQLPSTDFTQVDWFSLDENQINSLLTQISQIQIFSVQKDSSGRYADKFGELIYTLLSKNDSIDSILGKNGFTSNDLSVVEDSSTGSKKSNFSSWTGTISNQGSYSYTSSKGETITVTNQNVDTDGEVYKLSHLFGLIKKTKITSSNFDYKTDLSKEDLKDILSTLSSSYPLRKMLPSIMDYSINKIGNINVGESSIDLTLIDTSILSSEDNSLREDEIDLFTNFYEMIIDGTLDTLKDIFKDDDSALNVSQDQITKIENTLNYFAKMKMTRSVKTGKSISFFDEVISTIFNTSCLDQSLTGASNKADAKVLMLPYIKAIGREESTSKYKWEFDLDSTLTSTQRKEAVYSNTTSQILSITKLIRYASENKINLYALRSIIGQGSSSVSSAHLKQILTYQNQSKIFHFGLGNLFKTIFKTINFESYLSTGSDSTSLKIDTYTHLDMNESSINYWQKNIDSLCELYDVINSKSSGYNNFDNISIGKGDDKVSTYQLIKPLKGMPLLDNKREYLVYNLLSKMKTSSSSYDVRNYIRPSGDVTSSSIVSKKVLKIKNLLFNESYSNDELKIQCDILDNIIELSSTISESDLSGSSDQINLGNNLFNLILSMYNYQDSDGSYLGDKSSRGYFASEIVSNILIERLTQVDSSLESFYKELLFASDSYGKDYRYLNIIEANGLKGLIILSKFDNDYFSSSTNKEAGYPEFVAAFKLLGRKLNSTYTGSSYYGQLTSSEISLLNATEEDTSLNKYYANNDTSVKLNNSRLAIELFNSYASKVVVYKVTNPLTGDVIKTFTLKDIVTTAGIDFNNVSFEEGCDSIVTIIKSTIGA
jgi:hypothetical protein